MWGFAFIRCDACLEGLGGKGRRGEGRGRYKNTDEELICSFASADISLIDRWVDIAEVVCSSYLVTYGLDTPSYLSRYLMKNSLNLSDPHTSHNFKVNYLQDYK